MGSGETLMTFRPHHVSYPLYDEFSYLQRRVVAGTVREPNIINFLPAPPGNCSVYFKGVIPQSYADNGLRVYIHWTTSVVALTNVIFGAAFEKVDNSFQITSDSFALPQTVSDLSSLNGSDYMRVCYISFTNAQIDGLGAGDRFRIKLYRDTDDAGDTHAGIVGVHGIEIREETA